MTPEEMAVLVSGMIAGWIDKYAHDTKHPWRVIHMEPGDPLVVEVDGGVRLEISVVAGRNE